MTMNSRRQFLKITAAASAGVALMGAAALPRKPNIIILLADDPGWGDTGPYGGTEIPTPHLDALAREGARFTDGYASGPVCSPSRAGLMTGRHGARYGFDANVTDGKKRDGVTRALDLAQVTFAQRFKALGYATGLTGKWHLGDEAGYRPIDRGFDYFYGYYPASLHPPEGEVWRNQEPVPVPDDPTEAFTAEAEAFIRRNSDKPFFLYAPFSAVHAPHHGFPRWLSKVPAAVPEKRRRYAADLMQLDDSVGRIRKTLSDLHLEKDTLLFFYGDNGGPGGVATNGPLKGGKWTLWEGGIRVPFFAAWPGQIPGGQAIPTPIQQLDLMPTALSAAGAAIDPAWKLDGVDLLPHLKGGAPPAPRDLFWRFGPQMAVRRGDLKWVKAGLELPPALFNVREDPGESKDLSATMPEVAKNLKARWDAWNLGNEKPRWTDERWNGDESRKKAKASRKGR